MCLELKNPIWSLRVSIIVIPTHFRSLHVSSIAMFQNAGHKKRKLTAHAPLQYASSIAIFVSHSGNQVLMLLTLRLPNSVA